MEKEISKRIKEARISKGLTQQDIADHLGKTAAAISDLERGRVQVSAIDLYKISEKLNTPIEYFFGEILGPETAQKIISIARRMDKEEQTILLNYLISTEEMLNFIDKIEEDNPQLEEEQKKYLQEFYKNLIPYLDSIDAMRTKTLEMKIKLERVLEL